MFTDHDSAHQLERELAASWGVDVRVTRIV